MAAILFSVIALGVRGTFHHKPEKLAEVKAKLYRQLSEYLAETKGQITPGAYHVLAQGLKRVSPAVTLMRIGIVGLGIVILYWIVTRGLWLGLVSELRGVVAALN
jgi:type VI protein secretion system component VasF